MRCSVLPTVAPSPSARRMIGDDQKAPGLQRREHLAVHLGAVDRHVGHVVIGEEKRDEVEPADLGRDRIVVIPDHVHDVLHGRFLGADIELVLDDALDQRGRILRVHHAGRRDRARQQLRAVAAARLHIQHLHSRPRADKSQHFGRLAALVGLPVRVAAVGCRDNRLIIRCPGVLRGCRNRSPCRAHRNNGKHADRTCKTLNEQGHVGKIPLVAVQHSKTMAEDHGLNRGGDAIVKRTSASTMPVGI